MSLTSWPPENGNSAASSPRAALGCDCAQNNVPDRVTRKLPNLGSGRCTVTVASTSIGVVEVRTRVVVAATTIFCVTMVAVLVIILVAVLFSVLVTVEEDPSEVEGWVRGLCLHERQQRSSWVCSLVQLSTAAVTILVPVVTITITVSSLKIVLVTLEVIV